MTLEILEDQPTDFSATIGDQQKLLYKSGQNAYAIDKRAIRNYKEAGSRHCALVHTAAASNDPRQQLLAAIAAKKGVQEAIDQIAEINPTPKPNKSDKVDGKWKLLWSSDVAEVSKVTR